RGRSRRARLVAQIENVKRCTRAITTCVLTIIGMVPPSVMTTSVVAAGRDEREARVRDDVRLIAKHLQESLCYGRVARRAPMTVGKKMSRIGSQYVVEIDADKLAKDRSS